MRTNYYIYLNLSSEGEPEYIGITRNPSKRQSIAINHKLIRLKVDRISVSCVESRLIRFYKPRFNMNQKKGNSRFSTENERQWYRLHRPEIKIKATELGAWYKVA